MEIYANHRGKYPPIERRKGPSVYIATIEKAHMLINYLIEQQKISEDYRLLG